MHKFKIFTMLKFNNIHNISFLLLFLLPVLIIEGCKKTSGTLNQIVDAQTVDYSLSQNWMCHPILKSNDIARQ